MSTVWDFTKVYRFYAMYRRTTELYVLVPNITEILIVMTSVLQYRHK